MDASMSPSTKPLYRGTQAVWYIVGILEALLAFRLVLKLLGANSAAPFTSLIYSITQVFVTPFQNVFSTTRVVGSVFEWATVLAMVVYWLIAAAIIKLFIMSKPVSTPEAAVKLDSQDI
jgi:uncharacterized membrane protein YuzA (DUF378 family)